MSSKHAGVCCKAKSAALGQEESSDSCGEARASHPLREKGILKQGTEPWGAEAQSLVLLLFNAVCTQRSQNLHLWGGMYGVKICHCLEGWNW